MCVWVLFHLALELQCVSTNVLKMKSSTGNKSFSYISGRKWCLQQQKQRKKNGQTKFSIKLKTKDTHSSKGILHLYHRHKSIFGDFIPSTFRIGAIVFIWWKNIGRHVALLNGIGWTFGANLFSNVYRSYNVNDYNDYCRNSIKFGFPCCSRAWVRR